jgi:membrane fusion protein, multidrug efflux system
MPEESSRIPAKSTTPQAHLFRKPSRWPRVGLPIATIVLLMLWILGTFHRGMIQGKKLPVPQEAAAGAVIYKVVARTMPTSTEAVGTVQAEQIASITSRVVASITEMRASAGEQVAKGQTVVVLDDRDLRHRLEQAQEAVRGAEATLEQAQSDYRRDKPLFDQQVITPYDFEHTQTNLKTAQANLKRLQQAQNEAEVNLSYAVIRSPFDGVVIDKQADLGDLAAPGRPLFTLYEQGRLWLEANVPEELMAHVRLNQPMNVHIDATEREMQGRVAEIVPSSDPASRTEIVRVHLTSTQQLVPGMFGRLIIPLAPEPLLTIPEAALIRAGQLTMVDVVREGAIERRTVQLGRLIEGDYEVLSGLASGESVVLRAARSMVSPAAKGADDR